MVAQCGTPGFQAGAGADQIAGVTFMHAGVHTEAGKMFRVSKEVFGVFVFLRCLVGWLCFSPVASRVSPRRATYFFCFAKKSKQKKASHVRAASRSLALLAAFGALANSLRSNSASALIRTLLRCSARPNGGGIPLGSSASRTSPEWLVRFANLAGVGVASFVCPHCSQGHGTPCHYT